MANAKVFEKLYLKYYPVLLVYGKTITRNEQLVEDTIQELFIALWQKWDELSFKSSLENYLLVAFRNNLIRELKALSLAALTPDIFKETEKEPSIEKEEKLSILLEQLPPRQKEVLFLRYYKSKSYQEISEILGITYQVARNFSYRALKFLKKNSEMLSLLMLYM
ncbi:MAG: RNA polymerase sigma factor (sigma-70 family) [Saprospiraceae bacterium]|jgi:RNA polymerase sigma factor (sigma-70 family)